MGAFAGIGGRLRGPAVYHTIRLAVYHALCFLLVSQLLHEHATRQSKATSMAAGQMAAPTGRHCTLAQACRIKRARQNSRHSPAHFRNSSMVP